MDKKTIVLGSDHAGFKLKEMLCEYVASKGYNVINVGTYSEESCDYPEFAGKLCMTIREGKADLGILVCGTGVGMSIAANKYKGIRAACCSDTFSARLTRAHNDANVLCVGDRVLGIGLACELVDAFLGTEFEGGRHIRRVAMFEDGVEN